jgi:16S rRNA (uracil1498-N3)-methyltransferase
MAQFQRVTINVNQIQQNQIFLTPEQQHYLRRVLRLRDGDRWIAMDGMGNWWLAQLTGEQANIVESLKVATELPVLITLMIALPKGNGFDEVVRCCTELGVSTIAPVLSDRTLLHPSPQKLDRWRRIATEAAEQSERSCIPTILEPEIFATAISECDTTYRYLCAARGEYPHLSQVINNNTPSLGSEITIVTGPEGGWTNREVEIAISQGFEPTSLGSRILRAVTAPIVALSLLSTVEAKVY